MEQLQMSYVAPEEGSHIRPPIPVAFLFDHVVKMSMNVNYGYEEEFQVIIKSANFNYNNYTLVLYAETRNSAIIGIKILLKKILLA